MELSFSAQGNHACLCKHRLHSVRHPCAETPLLASPCGHKKRPVNNRVPHQLRAMDAHLVQHKRAHSASQWSEDDHFLQVPDLSLKLLNPASKVASLSSSLVTEKRLFPLAAPGSSVGDNACCQLRPRDVHVWVQITDGRKRGILRTCGSNSWMGTTEPLPW